VRDANVVGEVISKLRHERGWRQDDLVARMQILGCPMTRDILANIETDRSSVTDRQIVSFSVAFGVTVAELFPKDAINGWQVVGVSDDDRTRRKTNSDE